MKRIVLLTLLFFVGLAVLSFLSPSDFLGTRRFYFVSACESPITYRIGRIDSRFDLSSEEVQSALLEASSIWNNAFGKDLFLYSPEAKLEIYMIYDRRQFLSTRINSLDTVLEADKSSLDKEIAAYKNSSADFDRRSSEFGKKVEYWNSQGGAPKEEYDKLTSEQQSLRDEATRLNETAKRLNLSTSQYNSQVYELNQTVDSLNSALLIKPEEGLYDPQNNRIAIFFHNDRDELIRTMAHELGHARGLGHSLDQNSIMYPSTTKSLIPSREEIEKLKEICRKRPFYEPILEFTLLYLKRN